MLFLGLVGLVGMNVYAAAWIAEVAVLMLGGMVMRTGADDL